VKPGARALLEHERPLAGFLFELARIPIDLNELRVQPMDDSGMGSLQIAPFDRARRFGSCPAECHFYDVDGTPVSVALNLDQTGAPFEIDVWRVDFRPTRGWPLRAELRAGPPDSSLEPAPQSGSA
jgi:hypothetical protein